MQTFLLISFAGSIFAGVLGALLGLGGGIIIIPFLTLLLGVDIKYAIGASIISVIATSSGTASTYIRDWLTNRRIGLLLGVATTIGAITGALAAGYISKEILYVIFGVVFAGLALAMLRTRRAGLADGTTNHPWSERLRLASAYPEAARGQVLPYNVAGVPLSMALMYLDGIAAGLLGIGGGVAAVLTMDLVMKLPFKVSSATSSFIIGLTAVASAGIYFTRGEIIPIVVAPVALGVLLGSVVGAKLMVRTRSSVIRHVFIVILIVVAVQMAAKGLNLHLP